MTALVRNVPALPATVEDLIARRQTMTAPTLNDMVDSIHLALWPKPEYQRLLDAVHDEDAEEGSLDFDTFEAAKMIRAHALETGQAYVANKKGATIAKALNVVMRRYGIGRRQRLNQIAGMNVPETDEPVAPSGQVEQPAAPAATSAA